MISRLPPRAPAGSETVINETSFTLSSRCSRTVVIIYIIIYVYGYDYNSPYVRVLVRPVRRVRAHKGHRHADFAVVVVRARRGVDDTVTSSVTGVRRKRTLSEVTVFTAETKKPARRFSVWPVSAVNEKRSVPVSVETYVFTKRRYRLSRTCCRKKKPTRVHIVCSLLRSVFRTDFFLFFKRLHRVIPFFEAPVNYIILFPNHPKSTKFFFTPLLLPKIVL